VNESVIAGRRNRLVAGFNIHNGEVDSQVFGNNPGAVKGPLFGRTLDKSQNYSSYLENSFYFLPNVALVTGFQHLFAVRDRTTLAGMSVPGTAEHDLWSPKVGLLWNVDPGWQVFTNLSRSAEAPSFGEAGTIGNFTTLRPQKATTFEIGTRGIRENLTLRRGESLYKLTNDSINQTMSRTIVTNGLVFLSVLALVLFGGEVLRGFSLALFVGSIAGTYSTIAIASPIAIWWQGKLGAAKVKVKDTPKGDKLASASRRSVTRRPVTR